MPRGGSRHDGAAHRLCRHDPSRPGLGRRRGGLAEAGSLLELSEGGKRPLTLPTGETRTFLSDGDRVIFRGWCEREGFARIGLGECAGVVLPVRVDAL